MGTFIPGSAKSSGSPQYLRDNETRKQWAGVAHCHQGSPIQCTRLKICTIIDPPRQTTIFLNSQGCSASVASYYEQFNNTINMLEHCGASLGEDDGIITKVLKHHDIAPAMATARQKENAQNEAQEWYYGLAFLMGADCVHFGRYLVDLENDFMQGIDRYPKS